jgi:YfiH family protein
VAFVADTTGILRVPEWLDLPWLVHGFTTAKAGDFTRGLADAAQTAEAIEAGGMRVRTLRQVHSNLLVSVNGDEGSACGAPDREADGFITSHAGEVVAVRTADCVPILLVDRRNLVVAAVHAGWRGTVAEIARHAVERASAEFGCRPEELEAAIGPAIGSCCFEVGDEVAAQFDPSLIHSSAKPHIDLIEANRRQLIRAGLRDEQIRHSGDCTFCAPQRFYSYRRQGAASGRMLAFAGIRESSQGAA